MIFQDISKDNKKTITFVRNLFANLNGILDLLHLFWPEMWSLIYLNNFAETYAVTLVLAKFVKKTHVTLWNSVKQYHVTLLETYTILLNVWLTMFRAKNW